MTITNENGILRDENNNTASVAYWGSEEAARKALESCSDCSDCSDCSGCSRCSRCSHCSGCSRCSDCSGCSHCYGCSGCSRCSDCYGCSHCYGCSRCSDCSGCSHCSDCYGKTQKPLEIPVISEIHKAIYAAASKPGALDMREFHKCSTTHCRAGWAVVLAGPEGFALEKKTSPLFAAMQIYKASGYEISPCRFFDSDEAAMADMKRLAGAE